ncbi:Abi family protein [Fructobacillus durionis]|uniref:Abortive infection bacteriophage resistance protein n=1 Tax=Fructobacillus durionis TaxID=283737 RepID=A0A1I1HN93_9LACO|nr:Abi family protein [Fructobacillus durionis]SFC25434.1 Abortive infection bacteriophage resistance protein [Fructobacillus durionis]
MVANLSTNDLIELLNDRGMIIDDVNAEQQLKNIGYYKIKEYAEPFIRDGEYGGLLFSSIVRRYYHDKNLRMHLLDMIEIIELAFKNRISYELGSLGAFNYLNFLSWADTNIFSDEYIINQQTFIKKQLLTMISKENKKEYKRTENFTKIGYKYNKNSKKGTEYPSIWLAVELLSFGQIQHLFEIMTPQMKLSISKDFGCTPKMLESWIGTIVFARNQCAHNSNLVDVKLRTVPKIRYNWKDVIVNISTDEGKTLYSNRVSSIILPIVELVNKIDPNYGFGNLASDLKNISNKVRKDGQNLSNMIGFKSKRKMMKFLLEYRNYEQ